MCVIPDVGFVSQERIGSLDAAERPFVFFPGAPDLVVEVISPNDRLTRDVHGQGGKNGLPHGTLMVIVVNPRNRTVQVYTSDGVIELTEADTLGGGDVVPGWTMPVADIFS